MFDFLHRNYVTFDLTLIDGKDKYKFNNVKRRELPRVGDVLDCWPRNDDFKDKYVVQEVRHDLGNLLDCNPKEQTRPRITATVLK